MCKDCENYKPRQKATGASQAVFDSLKNYTKRLEQERDELKAELSVRTNQLAAMRVERDKWIAEADRLKGELGGNGKKVAVSGCITPLIADAIRKHEMFLWPCTISHENAWPHTVPVTITLDKEEK